MSAAAQDLADHDVPALAARIVTAVAAAEADRSVQLNVRLHSPSVRTAAARLGRAQPTDSALVDALPEGVTVVDGFTWTTGDDGLRMLAGNPFVIRIASLQSDEAGVITAIVESAYNVRYSVPEGTRVAVGGFHYKIVLTRDRGRWRVISATVIGQA